ncbi:hypothetical protein GJ496_007668 [Pomphorhynchus laevis]|nr:hypothetical protein GJ496_007668 [Pomphorhynchus laevis]
MSLVFGVNPFMFARIEHRQQHLSSRLTRAGHPRADLCFRRTPVVVASNNRKQADQRALNICFGRHNIAGSGVHSVFYPCSITRFCPDDSITSGSVIRVRCGICGWCVCLIYIVTS